MIVTLSAQVQQDLQQQYNTQCTALAASLCHWCAGEEGGAAQVEKAAVKRSTTGEAMVGAVKPCTRASGEAAWFGLEHRMM